MNTEDFVRYWGIWHDIDGGFWMRKSNGMLLGYPSPGMAQAHANGLMVNGDALGRKFANLSVREFPYAVTNEKQEA